MSKRALLLVCAALLLAVAAPLATLLAKPPYVRNADMPLGSYKMFSGEEVRLWHEKCDLENEYHEHVYYYTVGK